ncbi:MAG: protein TolR [Holosporaceae bacterium]|jgi:biopolymer transport protein TolR|nr:protein TolR [Holosporaceae bacterium]
MAFIPAKRGGSYQRPLMSDMNVTPMIDVMLVLLVIFMITAPLLTVGVKVDLPNANAPNVGGNETPIIVHINKEGAVFIGEMEVDVKTLSDKLRAITHESVEDTKIFVKGDKMIPYGTIMEIMGRISSSGFKKVVLITELPRKQGSDASKKR